MDEAKVLEEQRKLNELQFSIIQFVLKEYPEVKPELKYVLLEMAGMSDKRVTAIYNKDNPDSCDIDCLSDDEEEEQTSKKKAKKNYKKQK